MTLHELLLACAQRDIRIEVDAPCNALDLDWPAGALTEELLAALRRHKDVLVRVLPKLRAMTDNAAHAPVPCAVRTRPLGVGICFSCGASIAPADYGRCDDCAIAAELFWLDAGHERQRDAQAGGTEPRAQGAEVDADAGSRVLAASAARRRRPC